MSWKDQIQRFDRVASTMDTARQLAADGAVHGTAVVAAAQTAGRGRRGRSWFAPPGAGLWLTVILRPPPDAPDMQALGLVAGVAVLDAVSSCGAVGVQLKWPNDVVVGGRKLAGLLVEADGIGGNAPLVLVGIGVNLGARAAVAPPPEIRERYVGFADVGPAPAAALLLERLLDALELWYGRWLRLGVGPVLDRWRQADALRGCRVRADAGRVVEGVADGITERGELRVETPAGTVCINAGEVEALRPL